MNDSSNYISKYETIEDIKLTDEEFNEYSRVKEEIIQGQINENSAINSINISNIKQEYPLLDDSVINRLMMDLKGYGKIDALLDDDDLEEVMIIGDNLPVYVYHRSKGMMITDITLESNEIRQIIEKIANSVDRKIDNQTPILDARLPDGSRVNATLPPVSTNGPTITIRKFKQDPLTIIDLIKSNTISVDLAGFLWTTIEGLGVKPSNIIIAGGTSSGKTTTLNTLTSFIPPYERIITIEDTLELQIPHQHIIQTETRPANIENKGEITMDLLLKNSLRQRPDRIIVGEVRSSEAITLFSALNTGHSGIGTLHSNSSHETITRLTNAPMNVPSIMIQSIDFIIMQNRLHGSNDTVIRRVTKVAEIVGSENNTIQLNKIFEYNSQSDKIEFSAINCNALNKIAKLKGVSYNDVVDEIKNRTKYLIEYMEKYDGDIDHVQSYINKYYSL
ncbi:MAG: CpaF family protein [Methanosphaera sp.]|nr:CpaF family protein [Methanosphaera sp.]